MYLSDKLIQQRAACKRYRARHPERMKAIRRKGELKLKYKISQETYNALLQAQGNGCAICGGVPYGRWNKYLSVDHNHVTGKIRGLLCVACNSLLGMAKDDIVRLEIAIAYLEKHKE